MTGTARAAGVKPRLGLVTIGQTPRPDLVRVFGAAAPHAEVVVAGALDGVDAGTLAGLAAPGAYPLLVRLADGTTAEIARDRLHPRVEAAAGRLAQGGAAIVVIVCAGEFPEVACGAPVLLPGRVVPAAVGALAATRRVGVVVPNRGQVPFAERKWRADGFDARVTWASPVTEDNVPRAAAALADHALELIVLDCMGHDEGFRAAFARAAGRPVVAAQTLVARLAAALI